MLPVFKVSLRLLDDANATKSYIGYDAKNCQRKHAGEPKRNINTGDKVWKMVYPAYSAGPSHASRLIFMRFDCLCGKLTSRSL